MLLVLRSGNKKGLENVSTAQPTRTVDRITTALQDTNPRFRVRAGESMAVKHNEVTAITRYVEHVTAPLISVQSSTVCLGEKETAEIQRKMMRGRKSWNVNFSDDFLWRKISKRTKMVKK
jgi:hypothetical protein